MNHPLPDWRIDRHTVHVWHAVVDDHRQALENYRQFLAVDEVEQSRRLRFADGQAQYVLTRGLLRFLMGRYLGRPPETLRFVYNAYGKPELAPPLDRDTLKFNVSHSHGHILLAFASDRELGVDLEFRREISDFEGLAGRYFSAVEQTELVAIPPAARQHEFFNLWTLKEAFIKARGMGLSLPLDSFHIVRLAGDRIPFCQVVTYDRPEEGPRWSLAQLDVPAGFSSAIAVAGDDWSVDYRDCSLKLMVHAGLKPR